MNHTNILKLITETVPQKYSVINIFCYDLDLVLLLQNPVGWSNCMDTQFTIALILNRLISPIKAILHFTIDKLCDYTLMLWKRGQMVFP